MQAAAKTSLGSTRQVVESIGPLPALESLCARMNSTRFRSFSRQSAQRSVRRWILDVEPSQVRALYLESSYLRAWERQTGLPLGLLLLEAVGLKFDPWFFGYFGAHGEWLEEVEDLALRHLKRLYDRGVAVTVRV